MKKSKKEIVKSFIDWLFLHGHVVEGYDGPELDAPFNELWFNYEIQKPEEAEDE